MSEHETPRAVALVSGGMDSVVSLAMALETHDVRLVLFVDYGQRACEGERHSVMAVANYYGLPFREVSLRWLGELAPASMRSGEADATTLSELDDVWIPNRNGVFLNVAAAYAESYGCGSVVCGFNREEAVEFPDNSGRFVDAANAALGFSTRNRVAVHSPTVGMTKREILRHGAEIRAPLSVIWSCYRSGPRMCGTCASCRRLRVAIDSLPRDVRPPVEFEEE